MSNLAWEDQLLALFCFVLGLWPLAPTIASSARMKLQGRLRGQSRLVELGLEDKLPAIFSPFAFRWPVCRMKVQRLHLRQAHSMSNWED